MRLGLFLVAALTAFGQRPEPEVRGTIYERGSDTPIAGAEVQLFEFGPNEQNFIVRRLVVAGFSGTDGTFSLKPGHVGQFSLAASKTGYRQTGGPGATLTTESPVGMIRVSLARPGLLMGRVIDIDGNPVANFPLDILMGRVSDIENPWDLMGGAQATTDRDGYFRQEVEPGAYIAKVSPRPTEHDELLEYSEEAFQIVDEDIEPSYWPGGLSDQEGVLPVPVAGGGSGNIGAITVRKTRYYRVHVSLAGECAANELWIYRILTEPRELISNPEQYGGCRQEFLLTGLKPGSHTFAVWDRDVTAWGLAQFTITNRNVEASLRLTPSIGVSGRVKAADGHKLEELGPVQVLLRPEQGLGASRMDNPVDVDGAFLYETVAWPRQLFAAQARKPGTYVKEIRYNGLPMRSPRVDMIPGAGFEVLVDSGAATLTGTIKGFDHMLVVRDGFEPFKIDHLPPFQFMGAGESTVTVGNLPPGSYRVITVGVNSEDRIKTADELAARLARAQKVSLEINERKQIDVRE